MLLGEHKAPGLKYTWLRRNMKAARLEGPEESNLRTLRDFMRMLRAPRLYVNMKFMNSMGVWARIDD